MQRLVADARQRGDRRLSLEVIEGNEAALALYHRAGLRIVRTLTGHQAPAEAPPGDGGAAGGRSADRQPSPDGGRRHRPAPADRPRIAVQAAGQTAGLYAQSSSLRRGDARRRALLAAPDLRAATAPRRGHARALLAALQTRFAPLPLTANVFVPEVAAPSLRILAGGRIPAPVRDGYAAGQPTRIKPRDNDGRKTGKEIHPRRGGWRRAADVGRLRAAAAHRARPSNGWRISRCWR